MRHRHYTVILRWTALILGIGAIGYAGVFCWRTYRAYQESRTTIASLRSTIAELSTNLSLTAYERDHLTALLASTEDRVESLQTTSTELAGTIDELTKLTELDPELLKKYSKVYFLNEHYTPASLTDIDPLYISAQGKKLQIHAQVWPYLKRMLDQADLDGVSLRVASAYRSFGTQAALKSTYKVTYGTTAANKFSADQGYSEHQLGTTVDLTTKSSGTLSASFEKTPEFRWLIDHAHEYGFVLSYPKNNKYYVYEPWHWRFVGVGLATMLHTENTYLYDIDQREIDTYLPELFD